MLLGLLIFPAGCWENLFGQQKDTVYIQAGDPVVNAAGFRPYTNIWNMYDENPTGKFVKTGQWFDTVNLIGNHTEPVLQRKQTVRYLNGITRLHYDEVYQNNLLAIQSRIVHQEGSGSTIIADVHYKYNHIEGYRFFNIDGEGKQGEIPSKFSFELEKPVYEWHLWGILISGFPLKENFAARFLTHSSPGFNNAPFLWVTLSVTGSETVVSTRHGKVDCWIVRVTAEAPWTFWIAKNKEFPPVQQIKIEETSERFKWWKPS